MARADLHTHTHFSPDSLLRPQAFVERAASAGLTHVAVTDHGSVEGAYALRAIAPFEVIVGQEVKTSGGELLALYIEERIPNGLSPGLSAARIRAQGGIAIAPHPFDPFRPSLGQRGLDELGAALDAIEGHNGRSLFKARDLRARGLAQRRGLPLSLGSDAHTARELGRSWIDLPDFEGPADLLAALAEANYQPARPTPWLLPLSGVARARWLFGWRPPPPTEHSGAA